MLINALILAVFLLAGCTGVSSPANTAPPAPSTPTPYEFDRDKARAISDSMVDALIKNDRPALYSKMENAAREQHDQAAFDEIIDNMLGLFGSPVEVKFKKVAQGRRLGSGGYDKPMLKHWYAVRTPKHDYGSHFIFVEIVPDEEEYASSGIAIVNFPMSVPEDMQ